MGSGKELECDGCEPFLLSYLLNLSASLETCANRCDQLTIYRKQIRGNTVYRDGKRDSLLQSLREPDERCKSFRINRLEIGLYWREASTRRFDPAGQGNRL